MVSYSKRIDSDVIEQILGETLQEETGADVDTCLESVVVEGKFATLVFQCVLTTSAATITRNFGCYFHLGRFSASQWEDSVRNLAKVLLEELKTAGAGSN
jgi:hypothetical protein